uniref:Inositol polyphosphate-related phosphatase domain-containing protein n=1 Tax=Euplotes crassus TaxID=5936 RepID=A0A7S3NZ13_EUPCR|mmetsp:Transcript_36617/g.36221  ORF Transcript_36617/g.36221 Transcript_36617/m.36221 type:complete len:451 (+) Transcript_36617:2-1354(+)
MGPNTLSEINALEREIQEEMKDSDQKQVISPVPDEIVQQIVSSDKKDEVFTKEEPKATSPKLTLLKSSSANQLYEEDEKKQEVSNLIETDKNAESKNGPKSLENDNDTYSDSPQSKQEFQASERGKDNSKMNILEEEKNENPNAMNLFKKAFIGKIEAYTDKIQKANRKAKQRIKREPIWAWDDEEAKSNTIRDNIIRILSITWNMNAKKPQIDLNTLLRPDINHDIIAVGSEECLKTIFKSAFGANKIKWVKMIQKCLGDEYKVVSSHSLMGIHLVVFASIRVIPMISNVKSKHIATGVWNSIGNKGGVGICFDIGRTSCLFINCHLASGEEDLKEERRMRDFHKIEMKLRLPDKNKVSFHSPDPQEDITRVSNRFDCCIWTGDFNFRFRRKNLKIIDLIKNNKFDILKENESLTLRLNAEKLLTDFIEGPIEFAPTYKILHNTDKYNK